MKYEMLLIGILVVCASISVGLIYSLWATHGRDNKLKLVFWTLVLCLPIIGWIFYGGMYTPPEVQESGSQARESDGIGAAPH